ncbi:MAG TPA: UDP-N-acetylmuramoyl-L-alanyl-D-glutamate--2,6-diaminopimelate ligase [Candidatus Omnitrophota bacterium]|nr:UDP-N-acetylmuramoyl-L-alanyl-D-glutamate--2,6-diaminopimelate ligase [Candidatus Omnitrophota bacterium]
MRLKDLLKDTFYTTKNRRLLDLEIKDVTCQSKNAGPGRLFVAISGDAQDGHRYVAEAIERGCPACLVDSLAGHSFPDSFPVVAVENTRFVFSLLSARMFEYPAKDVKVIGITGTNGKTTTAFLVYYLFNYFSSCGMVGTVHHRVGSQILPSRNTTPGAYDLHWMLAQMRKMRTEYCSMEVSSHSLAQDRVAHLAFHSAIFTNLSHEHLDYHRDLEAYFRAKAKLFLKSPQPEHRIVNRDDLYGARLFDMLAPHPVTFGLRSRADFIGHGIRVDLKGLSFLIDVRGETIPVKLRMPCLHNVYNALAAFACGYCEGWDPADIAQAMKAFPGVPGRMERVAPERDFYVFVDYAHTPQAVESVLRSVRPLATRRVITVFGCGGNRDSAKRAPMGKAASRYSDIVILTSDNPRFENPEMILDQIEDGLKADAGQKVFRISDREEAIAKALRLAGPEDVVLILGKGHERYQIVGDNHLPFDDREVARRILNERNHAYV